MVRLMSTRHFLLVASVCFVVSSLGVLSSLTRNTDTVSPGVAGELIQSKHRMLLQDDIWPEVTKTTCTLDEYDAGTCTCISSGCFTHPKEFERPKCMQMSNSEKTWLMILCNNVFGNCNWEEACCGCNKEPALCVPCVHVCDTQLFA